MKYHGDNFCLGNSCRLDGSPTTVMDYGSDTSDDPVLLLEVGIIFKMYGDDGVTPYSSFDVISWEIVEVIKKSL